MSDTGNVLLFPLREVGVQVVELEVSSLVFDAIASVRARALGNAQTHSGRNAMIQALLLVARHLLEDQAGSTGGLMTQSGLHRRNANLRVRQLLELASELAVLDVPAQGGE